MKIADQVGAEQLPALVLCRLKVIAYTQDPDLGAAEQPPTLADRQAREHRFKTFEFATLVAVEIGWRAVTNDIERPSQDFDGVAETICNSEETVALGVEGTRSHLCNPLADYRYESGGTPVGEVKAGARLQEGATASRELTNDVVDRLVSLKAELQRH